MLINIIISSIYIISLTPSPAIGIYTVATNRRRANVFRFQFKDIMSFDWKITEIVEIN